MFPDHLVFSWRHLGATGALCLLAALAPACGSSDGGGTPGGGLPSCEGVKRAVVTDIDETLTTADAEFLMELNDPTYDPKMRAGGPDLFNGYAERGYWVLYVTARPSTVNLAVTGETTEQATRRWLTDHGFPLGDRTRLTLAPQFLTGEPVRMYKAGALQDLAAEGFSFDEAYGNAVTDAEAYEDANIPKDATFTIGRLAGTNGTTPIAEQDFTAHAAEQLPKVPAVCTLP